MADGNFMTEGLASSSSTNFPELGQVVMTDQDTIAWVDSCLTKDHEEEFGSGWASLREALHEMDVSSPNKEAGSLSESANPQKTGDDVWWSTYDVDTSNIFLPTYDESLRDLATSDPEMDSYIPVNEEEIFKIWDLDLPAVEYDEGFVKELKRAIAESCPVETIAPPGSAAAGGSEPVDDLVSAIADLSLSPGSGLLR